MRHQAARAIALAGVIVTLAAARRGAVAEIGGESPLRPRLHREELLLTKPVQCPAFGLCVNHAHRCQHTSQKKEEAVQSIIYYRRVKRMTTPRREHDVGICWTHTDQEHHGPLLLPKQESRSHLRMLCATLANDGIPYKSFTL
ncbi:unnamed protein product [Chrysodeixis includens]|uniref:Secreted protein n=1 Tax=Chrysodeixis includens TaxID=689277 RepID=A0A9N8Q1D4_CHRIL|nr:unnamed protein product [Chrysodeixis includens]